MYICMCTYSYLRSVIGFVFFLLFAFGTLWANYSMALSERVPWSAKNTATVYAAISWISMSCVTT